MSYPQKSLLIVGAGLSGVCVGYQLFKSGQKVTVVDNGINHSSVVAAGMINPLVFRRMTKSWRADDFIPYLEAFYPELETFTGSAFYHPIPLRRMFSGVQERELWIGHQLNDAFSDYMDPILETDDTYDQAINEFGSGRVKHVSYLETNVFISAMHRALESSGVVFIREEMKYNQLHGTEYMGVKYDEVIFCEGYLGKNNPWFGQLPLNQTMGETLVIHSQSLPEDTVLNRKCFVLPRGDKTFKIGSTYHWHHANPTPTDKGCRQILDNLSFLTSEQVEVLEKDAGVRPTTYDRRPLIGTHPEQKHYHIFNGLGTKGYMIAPLLSKEFVDYLISGDPLDPQVDIQRTYHGR